jgi:hypothetical protein
VVGDDVLEPAAAEPVVLTADLMERYRAPLTELAARHGLSELVLLSPGRLAAEAEAGRSFLDVARFERQAARQFGVAVGVAPAAVLAIYDRHGGPIDFATYRRLYADPEYRFLRRELVAGVEVVTAWLGLDQRQGISEPPMIFGTVALLEGSSLFEGREWLAKDEADAWANHERLLARVSEGTHSTL